MPISRAALSAVIDRDGAGVRVTAIDLPRSRPRKECPVDFGDWNVGRVGHSKREGRR
jgi:hypothetical protein